MVAWFTVVVEANYIRGPVSLLFPHSGIRKRGGNNKETTSVVVLQIASDTNISHAHTCTHVSKSHTTTCKQTQKCAVMKVPFYVFFFLSFLLRPEGSATAHLGIRDFEIHLISRGFRISE